MIPDFQVIPHTADIQIRVFGTTQQELFKHALIGMFQSIGPKSSLCTMKKERLVCPALPCKREITITAGDQEQLLVDFLSYALYLSDVHNEAYLDATILSFSEQQIHAILLGVPVTTFEIAEIKAVTYHNLSIKQIDGVWQTDIVFDI